MSKDQKDRRQIAEMLYIQRINNEKPIENPDGESLALLKMFDEINALGYDYHYLADIDLRKITDVRVMELLCKYLPRMESIFTKQTFIQKIDPKKFPEIVDYAINEYLSFSPSDKMTLLEFDKVISKGKKTEDYFACISKLLQNGDSYATLWETRKTLGKDCPNKLLPYTRLYQQGVLLPLTLRDNIYYTDGETTAFLNYCLNITDEQLTDVIGQYDYKKNEYKYSLSVTVFEYWKKLCTKEYVRKEAQRVIRERNKRLGWG